ncbi:MAG: Ldh family oxidoreductase [Planctomycetota bacterium]
MPAMRVFSADLLRTWAGEVLKALGVSDEDAAVAADVLVLGNLRGVDSHGIRLLVKNAEGLRDGALNPAPAMRIVEEKGPCAVFDGDGGMGQLVCMRAMEAALGKAREEGAAVVATKRSSHCGMSAAYVLRAAQEDMIGVMLSNNKTSMAVAGGYDWTIGNNTIACGIPAVDHSPIVLDMSTSAITWGTVLTLAAAGGELPAYAAIRREPEGGPLTDPSKAYNEGTLLPIGGHKGSGLAVAIECLTGVLSGGPFAAEVSTVFLDTAKRENHSQFILVVSPEAFMETGVFKRRVSELITYIKNSPRLKSVEEILLPGEKSARCAAERSKRGVPLPQGVIESLNELAARVGAKPLPQGDASGRQT